MHFLAEAWLEEDGKQIAKTISDRRLRRRVGFRGGIPVADGRQSATAHVRSARDVHHGLRWLARAGVPWRLLPRDCERLPETLADLHFVIFSMLMLVHAALISGT